MRYNFRVWDGIKMNMTEDLDYMVYFDGRAWREECGELMHSTGLRDRDDQEIYEGDIIEYKSGANEIIIYCSEVIWDSASASFRLDPKFKVPFSEKIRDIKVVGNIYQNLLTNS